MSAIPLGYSIGDESYQPTVLPADSVPVFLWFGDGLAEGFSAPVAEVNTHPEFGEPSLGGLAPEYGYYWDKWLDETSANVWDKTARLTLASPAGAQFRKIHTRLGSTAATGPFSGLVDTNPAWGFAQRMFGQFVNPSGEALPIRVIICASTYGAAGEVPASPASSWDPGLTNSLWALASEHYIKPAINNIRAGSLRPFIVGMFHSSGMLDAAGPTAFAGAFDGLAGLWYESMEKIRLATSEFMNIGPMPTLNIQAYETTAAGLGANQILEWETVFNLQRTQRSQYRIIPLNGLERASNSLFLTGSGSWRLGMRVATTYRKWLSGNPRDLFAWEVTSDIA